MRAGLSMNVSGLKKVGRSAILMCFIPATLEILGYFFFAPHFLGTTKIEALIIGAVLAAVSPAVIVPRKIRLTEEGYGTKKQIPQMILAGAIAVSVGTANFTNPSVTMEIVSGIEEYMKKRGVVL